MDASDVMTAQMVTVKPCTTVPEVGRGDERSMQRAVVGLSVRMITGDPTAIAREVACELNKPVDAVKDAWAVVDPILGTYHRAQPYKPGSWGPRQAHALIAADGSWHNTILHNIREGGTMTAANELVLLLDVDNAGRTIATVRGAPL